MVNNYNFKSISFFVSLLAISLLLFSTAYSQTTHFSTSYARTQTVSNGRTNEFRSMKTDADGNAYILTYLSHIQSFNAQSYNPGLLLIKYNSLGEIQWAIGDDGKDGVALLLDSLGNPLIVGGQSVINGQGFSEGRIFITKYSATDGTVVWHNISTAGKGTTVEGATLSPDGHIYIAFTKSSSYYMEWGAISNFGFISGSNREAIIKTDANGNGLWAKFVTSDDTWNIQGNIYGISAGDDNEVYIVGKGQRLFSDAGTRGIFVSRINSDGTFSWFKRASTSDDHSATDVIYHQGYIYMCGDVTNQAYTSLDFGDGVNSTLDFQKGYIAKLAPDGTAQWLVNNTTGTKAGIGNGLRFLKLNALQNGNIVALANLKSQDIIFGGKTINSSYLYQGWLPATGDNTMVFELNTNGQLASSFTTSDGLTKAKILSSAPDNTVWIGGTYSSYYSANSLFKIGSNTHAHIGGVNDYNFFTARVTPEAVVLPVNLTKFDAKAIHNSAKLSWTTVSESNNKEFVISRSTNGVEFTIIGKVRGKGNSDQINRYELYDKEPFSGTNYYKLQQVDFDGKSTELGIKSLDFNLSALSLKVYPNPTTDYVNVIFTAGKYRELTVSTVTGNVLQTSSLDSSISQTSISLKEYEPGIYMVHLLGDLDKETIKVVKQ